jgi:nicotinamidase-related amidase
VSSGSTRRYFALPGRLRRWSTTGRQLTSSLRDGCRAQPAQTTADEPTAIRSPAPASPPELDPQECALLVLGCQPGVLDDLRDAQALISNINAAIDIVRLHGGHVGFARIALDDLDRQFTPSTNKEFSALARQRRFQNGTLESAIHQALAVQPGDVAIRTTRLGAFSTTDLDEQLTNLGVTTLIVSGAHTSGALLSTVREAADRDYRLIVLADCCADPDAETHRFLMTRIFPRQTEITTAAKLYMSLAADVDEPSNSPTGATP